MTLSLHGVPPSVRRIDAASLPRLTAPSQADHSGRQQRQTLIRTYEAHFGCRLVVMIDVIFPEAIPRLDDLLRDVDPVADLHLLLESPGGDGETAIRLARAAQARCRHLTVIVPRPTTSAATLLALGAHTILLGPTGDLRPVDPPFERIRNSRPRRARSMMKQARSTLERISGLITEALSSNPDRDERETAQLTVALRERLIDVRHDDRTAFAEAEAKSAGLNARTIDPASHQWRLISLLCGKYATLGSSVYEGTLASHVVPHRQAV